MSTEQTGCFTTYKGVPWLFFSPFCTYIDFFLSFLLKACLQILVDSCHPHIHPFPHIYKNVLNHSFHFWSFILLWKWVLYKKCLLLCIFCCVCVCVCLLKLWNWNWKLVSFFLYWSNCYAHLSAKRWYRWVSRVSSTNRNIVNCLTIIGQHTRVMQVYKHWELRRLSNTFRGSPAAPPMAPTQPRHSRRQHETLPGWGLAIWDPSWTSAIVPLLVTAMQSRTLTTIIDKDNMHWHREYSHVNSMSEDKF